MQQLETLCVATIASASAVVVSPHCVHKTVITG